MTAQTASRPVPRHIVGLILGFGILYSLTADWGLGANVDAIAAALPAWSIVADQSLHLDSFASANPWMVETPDGWVSNRPPGLFGLAIPAYLVAQSESFTNAPATATAVAATVAALAVLYVTLCRLVEPRVALIASTLVGMGTSTWSVSADSLWPHGPGQLWAALGLLGLSGAAFASTGLAFGMALLTRPITAISTAVVGISEGWNRRSLRPVMAIGVPAGTAMALLIAYNRVVFGSATISGGYTPEFAERLATEPTGGHLSRFAGFFLSPNNGVFPWSPITLLGVIGVALMWRTLPSWTRSTAVAALVYIFVHARLNRVSGGVPFGYRYPLEALTLAAPALTLGTLSLWRRGIWLRRAVVVTAGISILLQAALVFFYQCEPGLASEATCTLAF